MFSVALISENFSTLIGGTAIAVWFYTRRGGPFTPDWKSPVMKA
jgi:hypothetical protein